MELKRKYAVVSVGKALSHFIKKAELNLYSGSIKYNLNKFICLNKRKHILEHTLLGIICIYIYTNDLYNNNFSIEILVDNLFIFYSFLI